MFTAVRSPVRLFPALSRVFFVDRAILYRSVDIGQTCVSRHRSIRNRRAKSACRNEAAGKFVPAVAAVEAVAELIQEPLKVSAPTVLVVCAE